MEIPIPLLLTSEKKARSKRTRTGAAPSHLRPQAAQSPVWLPEDRSALGQDLSHRSKQRRGPQSAGPHYRPERTDNGPSWLTLLGHTKDSLWSLDLFRTESILLRSHWVLVVMDQFSRRIIGFGVQAIAVDGPGLCRMFNQAISGSGLPTRLSTDHDPLFQFHRWQANLRILDVERVQTVPQVPWSHPFIERSSPLSAASIWTVCSFGPQTTWSGNCGRSKNTTTRPACIRGYPATRLMRKPALQHSRQPTLRITAGKATAVGCLSCQSLL